MTLTFYTDVINRETCCMLEIKLTITFRENCNNTNDDTDGLQQGKKNHRNKEERKKSNETPFGK